MQNICLRNISGTRAGPRTFKRACLATFALLLSVGAAQALPVTTPPPLLTALGDVTALYIYANAGNASVLGEVTPVAFTQMFCNQTMGSCGGTPGQTKDLGVQSGPMVFSLKNTNTNTTFISNVADVNGNYHVKITSVFSDFGVGALSSDAATAVNAEIAAGLHVTYVGWEDLTLGQGSDFDYNDLIFAFANTVSSDDPPSGLPEPLTISLMGAGLLFVGGLWKKSKKKA